MQQLRAFIAVFENGTVTGAAGLLGRTQPQVSRLISNLEAELGFPLFVRERRRLVPTHRGARFYDEVRPALDGLDNIARLGEEIRRDTEAVLRILVPPYAAHTILPRALARFAARYPDRRYSVEILARNAMGSWITFHPFDVGVAALPFEIPAIKVKRFAAVETVVVMPKGHTLSAKRMIRARDLAGFPFIAMSRNTPLRQRLDEIFAREGVELRIRGETSTSVSACEMVEQGLGLAIVDAFVPLARDGRLIDFRRWKPGYRSQFGLIYPASGSTANAASDFSSIIVDVVLEAGSAYVTRLR